MIDPDAAHPERTTLSILPLDALVSRFRLGVENYDPRVVHLTDDQADTAFLEPAGVGRWPCRLLLGHMADADPVWNHRMRRAVAEDGPVFALWDENAFIDSGLYDAPPRSTPGTPSSRRLPTCAAYIAAVHSGRQWIGEWLSTLSADQAARTGMHPDRGPISVRTILELTTWHLEHHAWYLNRKVRKLLGGAR